MVHVKAELLSAKMKEVLKSKGVNNESLTHCVDSLVQTSLRGVDSHGINLFPHYCRAVDGGRINKNPSFTIEKKAVSAAILHADHGFGHHSGAAAMDYAIKQAKETGMCAIGVIDSSHYGAAAYFALRAAEQDCIGWSFTNADALVKAHNSKEAFFGTNPVCFTAPMAGEGPFCLDMATSGVSWNKIKNYRLADREIPGDWAYNEHGQFVTNPHDARSLRPTGDYKGFGLGMMVDILCGVLTGGMISKDMMPMFNSPIDQPRKVSHFFMAMDISKFTDPNSFKQNLQSMADRIRLLPKLTDDEVMVAGDPEKKQHKIRTVSGIPVEDNVWEEYLKIDAGFASCTL